MGIKDEVLSERAARIRNKIRQKPVSTFADQVSSNKGIRFEDAYHSLTKCGQDILMQRFSNINIKEADDALNKVVLQMIAETNPALEETSKNFLVAKLIWGIQNNFKPKEAYSDHVHLGNVASPIIEAMQKRLKELGLGRPTQEVSVT